MKERVTREDRILRSVVKNYMLDSRDDSVNYLTRCEDVKSEWQDTGFDLDGYLNMLKSKGKAWKDAVEFVEEESQYWD